MIRILLVDDQQAVIESLKASLKSIPDLKVVGVARGGQAAIAMVRKLHPDIVLIDMEMPGMDGIAATRIILREYSGVRVIVLSMHDEDNYVAQAVRAGAMGYLIKNTPAPELEAAIRSVHQGYAQIGPGLLQKVITVTPEPIKDDELGSLAARKYAGNGKISKSGIERFQLRNSNALRQKKTLYLAIWLVGNIFLWTSSLLYLKFRSPSYLSSWTIALPGTASSTSINLPEIGEVSSQNQSPFSNLIADPRENYKLLAESDDVIEPAAASLNMKLEKFGEPQVKVLDNSTLMQLSMEGLTPKEAKAKAIAVNQALQNKLAELKNLESGKPDPTTIRAIDNAQLRLEKARKQLADYQESSGLNSNAQLENLANSIEQMRVEKAALTTQQQKAQGKSKRLLEELKLTPQQAQEALSLHSDRLFRQYLSNYSQIKSELVNLTAKFLSSHPIILAKQDDLNIAETVLLDRASSIVGRPMDFESLRQLELNGNDNQFNSQKENLLEKLIDLQGEEQGLKQQTQELERQMFQLETRQKQRSRSGSELDRLKKNVQIAEAVYSSTLTQLEIKRNDTSNLYPPISVITQPNLPKKSNSLKTALVLLGSALGSCFLTTALLSLAWRDRRFDDSWYWKNNSNHNNHKALPNSNHNYSRDY